MARIGTDFPAMAHPPIQSLRERESLATPLVQRPLELAGRSGRALSDELAERLARHAV